MTDGLLESIIQQEKRIQVEVAAEQARAEEWQQRELTAIESTFAATLTAENEHGQRMLDAKKTSLERQGVDLESASSAWCRSLLDLDEATLNDTLERHLAAILPGGDHDHPHGQS